MSELDKFMSKSTMVTIRGVELEIKPFPSRFYPMLKESQDLLMRLIIATQNGKKLSEKESARKFELDLDIAFESMKMVFPDLTREIFDNEIPFDYVEEIMKEVYKVNGMTDESKKKATDLLLKFQNINSQKVENVEPKPEDTEQK